MAYTEPGYGGGLAMPAGKIGMIDRLMGESQRLHEEIEQLVHILQPVRSVGPDSANAQPQEAPANRLHEIILTVEAANQRLRVLKSELHL